MGTIAGLIIAVLSVLAALWVVGHPAPDNSDRYRRRNWWDE